MGIFASRLVGGTVGLMFSCLFAEFICRRLLGGSLRQHINPFRSSPSFWATKSLEFVLISMGHRSSRNGLWVYGRNMVAAKRALVECHFRAKSERGGERRQ